MSKALFITQDSLEELISTAKVQLEKFRLSSRDGSQIYHVVPAAKVLSCESNPDDPLSICNKVIPLTALTRINAVIYLNSITIGTHSYLIDQGYICYRSPGNE